MPLNIIHHKSWNIYNKETQARIARDEAEAQARDEAYNQKLQSYEAAKRLAVLQGRSPPQPPNLHEDYSSKRRRESDEDRARNERRDSKRKRARLLGEDETDRDLRLAKAHLEDAAAKKEQPAKSDATHRANRHQINAPIIDQDGHINLFPVDVEAEKKTEAEAAEKRKQRDLEDQYTMRFSNAAGRNGLGNKPWYSNSATGALAITNKIARVIAPNMPSAEKPDSKGELLDLFKDPTDAWGRPDPARKEREKARLMAADPLIAMQIGWKKTQEQDRAKAEWEKQRREERRKRDRELRRAEREERRERRRHERGHEAQDRDADGLEEFSLNAPAPHGHRDRDDDRYSRRTHEHNHRHSHRDRHGHHRQGEESRDRDGERHKHHHHHHHHDRHRSAHEKRN